MRQTHKESSQSYTDAFMKNLRYLLDAHGLTGNGFADALNMGHGTVHRYLNSSRMPNLAYIIAVAQYFGVSIDWLLGMSPDMHNSLSPDAEKLLRLYNFASVDDRNVIDAVLAKYKPFAEKQ